MPTGALHTGLTMLAALPRVLERQQLVVAWDGRNPWRKQIRTEYKANRVANEEDRRVRDGVFRQMQVALDIIETIGVAPVYHEQLEAEDWAGILSARTVAHGPPRELVTLLSPIGIGSSCCRTA